jgi:hypothetical protein
MSDQFLDDGDVVRSAGEDSLFSEADFLSPSPTPLVLKQVERIKDDIERDEFKSAFKVLHDHRNYLDDKPPALLTVEEQLVERLAGFKSGRIRDDIRSLFLEVGADVPYAERLVLAKRDFNSFPPERIHIRKSATDKVSLCGVNLPSPFPVTRGEMGDSSSLSCQACLSVASDDISAYPELRESSPFLAISRHEEKELILEAAEDLLGDLSATDLYSDGVGEFVRKVKETVHSSIWATLEKEAASRLYHLSPFERFHRLFGRVLVAQPGKGMEGDMEMGEAVEEAYGPSEGLTWPSEERLAQMVSHARQIASPGTRGGVFRAMLIAEAWPLALPSILSAIKAGHFSYPGVASVWEEEYPSLLL